MPMDSEDLRRYLEFYRDLGVGEVYVRRGLGARGWGRGSARDRGRGPSSPLGGAGLAAGSRLALPPMIATEGDSLLKILEDMGDCKRCRLHEGRTKLVFGVGDEKAPLVFVGEGPGADEDAQGIPFVGRAGQLLTQMIEGTAKKEGIDILRKDIYICNVVKCRPPENRTPGAG